MFRWCSYCYSFLGEKEPFEDLSITNGICPSCKTQVMDETFDTEKSKAILDLISNVKKAYKGEDYQSVKAFLEKCQELKLPLADVVLGLIVPSLYNVGELWSTNYLTVTQEHNYTKHCSELLQKIFLTLDEYVDYRNSSNPEVIIISSEDNDHFLGPQIVELLLMVNRIPSVLIHPSIPIPELLKLVNKVKPKVLGISISMAYQMTYVRNFISLLKNENYFPNIALGGFFIRSFSPSEIAKKFDYPNLYTFKDISDFIKFIRTTSHYVPLDEKTSL